jgi:uncharacterized protein (DUF433 family)
MSRVSNMKGSWQDRIESDPLVLHGKPCIKGTRIPVGLILGYLAENRDAGDIIRELPDLKLEDIGAALEYARDLADFEAVVNS